MNLTPGAIVNARFRLERPLASGAMGAVWVARHLDLDVPVAVKFIGASAAPASASRVRFEREARAAAQMRSPYVVQILDYGVDDGTPYLVMELLEGEDLRTRLERQERLSLAAVSAIVVQLAKGLKLAHDAGVVHRDLKPSNVFLARVGDEEIVKILDFGVAKEINPDGATESTTTGLLLGSPAYMSPEQARGGVIDARSDLWSLGVLCYLALTGRRPFAGGHVGDVLVKVCSSEAPPATSIAPDLPPEIDAFFERALCKSPDGRFATARVMADELAMIAARAANASVQPRPSAAPLEASAVTRSHATLSMQPAPKLPEEHEAKSASTAARSATLLEPAARSARSRWTWFAAAAVAFVALGVVLAAQLREGGATPKQVEIEPLATATATAGARPEPVVEPTPALPVTAPAASSAEPAATSTSAMPTAGTKRRPAPRPAPQAGRSSAPPQPTVDPKFGLPVKTSP